MQIKKFTLGDLASNCYVVYDGVSGYIVDPGYESEDVINFILENKIKLAFIYLTHGHFDHIGGVKKIKEYFNIPVYASQKDLFWLTTFAKQKFGYEVAVDIWIHEAMMIPFDHTDLIVYETPGHSEGGTVLYDAHNKYAFSGDTLFYQTIGRTDIPHANFEDIEKSVLKMYKLLPNDTIIYPGHGHSTTIAHEKRYNPYVREK